MFHGFRVSLKIGFRLVDQQQAAVGPFAFHFFRIHQLPVKFHGRLE